jgi:hypothetical protein
MLNEQAAEWWCQRLKLKGKKQVFKDAMLKYLPDEDYTTYNDYHPEGILLLAVREIIDNKGGIVSTRGLFPNKTGLKRCRDKLLVKEGYGANWIPLVDKKNTK